MRERPTATEQIVTFRAMGWGDRDDPLGANRTRVRRSSGAQHRRHLGFRRASSPLSCADFAKRFTDEAQEALATSDADRKQANDRREQAFESHSEIEPPGSLRQSLLPTPKLHLPRTGIWNLSQRQFQAAQWLSSLADGRRWSPLARLSLYHRACPL